MPLQVDFPIVDSTTEFIEPRKLINNEQNVVTFQSSTAFARITAFLGFLSDALVDTTLASPPPITAPIQSLLEILRRCEEWIEQCPPHTGARRFGNFAFREWHVLLDSQSRDLLTPLLPVPDAITEVLPYFLGSFGSAQRLDYGTGHELSFMAFCCTLFQLRVLHVDDHVDAQSIALSVYPKYLRIIQRLVVTYTLEPAGSHGVWGLDDHFAMPYLLGAAQLAQLDSGAFPTPASITNARDVNEYRERNLYYNAIGFINDVKKGPFWEHSPMLYDISGIDNWAKISTGMRKMYNVEVLGKFPVVQHFPFGSCFFPFTPQQSSSSEADRAETEKSRTAAIAELSEIQAQTKSLHTSQMAREKERRDADTPVPDEQPTSHRKAQIEQQVSTAAPWASASRHSSAGANQMGVKRTSMPPPALNPTTPRTPNQHRAPVEKVTENGEEMANTDGIEAGIGVDGAPGTKAPFQQTRTIHPAVLASMRRRDETVPDSTS